MTPKEGHPITRGVRPFQALDEWYYRIRFRPDDKRVTPILTTMLPKDNPKLETCAWATERGNNGRSFGFTGAHFHRNWGIDDFRRVVLNAILWTAHVDVPRGGAVSQVTPDQLSVNLDPKK
jgi:type 1 glutamine amidotransferase